MPSHQAKARPPHLFVGEVNAGHHGEGWIASLRSQ